MSVAVVRFPGSNCDTDCVRAVQQLAGEAPTVVWHEEALPADVRLVILPGGFSYGDYLRPGAIAHLSPIVQDIKRFVDRGGHVLGICNGFQVLTEAGLLPGALLPNAGLHFVCNNVQLRVHNMHTPYTSGYEPGQILSMPVAHGDGRYFADEDTLERLRDNNQIVFRYHEGNPNGALDDIAGICNEKGNVLGMMPHPERCVDPVLGNGTDGIPLLKAIIPQAVKQI